MDVSLWLLKGVRRYRSAGLRKTLEEGLTLLKREGSADEFDLKHGTDTSGHIKLWKLKVGSRNARFGCGYQTIAEQATVDAVNFLGEDPKNFTFVDIGCGKGRSLVVAANLGFQRIVGVEFVPQLADIARRNLENLQITQAAIVEMDAVNYQFQDQDTVLYFFNPFSEEVMSQVLANLSKSRMDKLYVIYASPRCAALLDSCGFLTRLGSPSGSGIQAWKKTPLQ